jgi:hypothetical protein
VSEADYEPRVFCVPFPLQMRHLCAWPADPHSVSTQSAPKSDANANAIANANAKDHANANENDRARVLVHVRALLSADDETNRAPNAWLLSVNEISIRQKKKKKKIIIKRMTNLSNRFFSCVHLQAMLINNL